MGAITIRGLDDQVIAAIKRQAAEHSVSMEEEVRSLLAKTYADDHRQKAREWAVRQLERLKQGELPQAKTGSVDEIRAMRRERSASLGSSDPRRR